MTIQDIISLFVENGVTIGVIIALMWFCKYLINHSFETQESKIDVLTEKIDKLVDVVNNLITRSDNNE